MRAKLSILSIALIVAGLCLAFEPIPASAAPPSLQTSNYSHTFDFTKDNGSWTTLPFDEKGLGGSTPTWGSYVASTGWAASYAEQTGWKANTLYIVFDLGATYSVSGLTMTYDIAPGNAAFDCQLHADVAVLDSTYTAVAYGSRAYCPHDPADHNTTTLSATGSGRYLLIWCRAGSSQDETVPGGTCMVTSASATVTDTTSAGDPFGGEGGAGPYKPISAYDLVSINDTHSIIETPPNSNVHSVTPGTVREITQTDPSHWTVEIDPGLGSGSGNMLHYFNLQGVNAEVGDTVAVGCVLGLTALSLDPNNQGGGNLGFDAPEPIQTDWPTYSDSPDNIPCNASKYQTATCINLNPNMADTAKNWSMVGAASYADSAIELGPAASFYQDLILDSTKDYMVTLAATVIASDRPTQVFVDFGDATAILALHPEQSGLYTDIVTQTLAPGTANFAPNTYRLQIYNNSSHAPEVAPTIRVKFACISETAPAKAPGACYWEDPDLKTNEWTGSAGVVYQAPSPDSTQSGEYIIPAGGEIHRAVDISAFVDADTTFQLLTKTNNGEGTPLAPPYGRWHAFIRDHDTEDLIQDIGTWDTMPIVVTVHVEPFTVASGVHVAGDLVIQNLTSGLAETGWDLNVWQACLQVKGGLWPGYGASDSGSLFNAQCTLCAQPGTIADVSTENLLGWVVQWLQFGWCYLGFILRCLLLILLNNLWGTVQGMLTGLALLGVWLGRVIAVLAAWAQDGGRFLFNNLIASLIPLANAVILWLFSLPLFQTLIDAAGIGLMWLAALFDLARGIFGLLVLAMQLVGALLGLVGVAFSAFVTGMSATPSIVFPIPDCTNPATPFYDACLPFDVMNYLFMQLPVFAVLINVAVFAVAWRQIKKIYRNVTEELNA